MLKKIVLLIISVVFVLPLIAMGTALIVVLRERIEEIKGGEEDDLSNY